VANALAHLSAIIIPSLIFYIVGYGLIHKSNVYEDFIKGASDGLKTVVSIVPTLIGLMMAVAVLRASGFLDFFGKLAGRIIAPTGFPSELTPLVFIKLFSSSAATGLVLDMSVYFLAAKVTKTRHTLAGALFATAAGIVMSVVMAKMMI